MRLLVVGSLFAVACASNVQGGGTGEGGSASDAAMATGTGGAVPEGIATGGAGGTPPPGPVAQGTGTGGAGQGAAGGSDLEDCSVSEAGLFAWWPVEEGLYEGTVCGLEADCHLSNHLGWQDVAAGLICAGDLADRGARGLALSQFVPCCGSGVDYVTIFRGDGTAWHQRRSWNEELSDPNEVPCGMVDPIQLCTVVAQCNCPTDGGWNPDDGVTDCVPADPPPTCDEVIAVLSQETDAGAGDTP